MKKLTTLHLPISLLITAGLLSAYSESSTVTAPKSPEAVPENSNTSATPIEGAWLLVWGKYRDNIRGPEKPYQMKLFSEKHFSLLHQQSADQWIGHAGTYELDGNIYKETILHTTDPAYLGISVWWNYEISNDTLWMTGPVKFFNSDEKEDKEMAGGYNYMKEARVRAE